MENLLNQDVDYKITETSRGTWRRFLDPTGALYTEFTSRATVVGAPLLHYTRGISPETGSAATARGFVAIGPRAVGVVAIGQMAAGLIAIGQLSVGLLALGQLALGLAVVGQIALGIAFGAGQLASGYVCVAQLGLGQWVLAQFGLGHHVWSLSLRDPAAIDFFQSLWR